MILSFIFSTSCTLHYKIDAAVSSNSEVSGTPSSSPTLTPDATGAVPTLQYSLSKNIFSSADTLSTQPSSNTLLTDFYVSPDLPTGLVINSSTGEISGSPTAPTLTQVYTVYAKSSAGVQVQSNLSFEVGANFTVNSTADQSDTVPGDGFCSSSSANCTLRAAIEEANAQANGITSIVNIPSGTYGLNTQPLTITSKILLLGANRNTTIIDANPDSTPISPAINIASSPKIVIEGITIRNAAIASAPAGSYQGIAIKSLADNIELKNCEISNNSINTTNAADVSGVGLYHSGNGIFLMDNCNITNNTANIPTPSSYSLGGGAYIASSDTQILNSNISNNTLTSATSGSSKGGALALGGGKSLIDKSVINSNVARNHGGAIWYSDNNHAEIKYSTLSENSANLLVFGTFIYAPKGGSLSISNSTIYKSSGSGAELIYADETQMDIKNSTIISTLALQLIELLSASLTVEGSTFSTPYDIIYFRLNTGSLFTKSSIYLSGNKACTTHATSVVSYCYNVFSDSYCNTGNNLDLVNTDPLLNALANNGCLTMTAATQSNSPARNLVPGNECLTQDQRDSSRLNGLFCDAGAYQHY